MIGVFDSGLGGLTALRRLHAIAPEASYIYFGDTARLPYGTRGQETILRYALEDLRFLSRFLPDVVLVACGTVSANALRVLQAVSEIPVLGVIEHAARAAVASTRNGRIGVLGTNATVRTHAYLHALLALVPSLFVTEVACPLFVPIVENGLTERTDSVVSNLCARYLEPVKRQGVDTLILGCTHYPLLAEAISATLPGVTLIDPGAEAADALAPRLRHDPRPVRQYYVSEDAASFAAAAERFLGESIHGRVKQIQI